MEHKDLKKLTAEWYERLEKEGFIDIEDAKSGALKSWSNRHVNGRRDKDFEGDLIREVDAYFHSALTVLNEFSFGCSRDKKIWRLHCDGLSTRQIATRLGNIDHCTAFQVVKKIRMLFLGTSRVQSVNKVVVRDGKLSDEAFIYSTWLRPLYYGNDAMSDIDKGAFMIFMHRRVEQIFELPAVNIKIACLEDAPDVILGYSVIEWRRLWWVYVKKAWREMGIAKKLVPSHINSCAYLTDFGKMLKPKDWDINPYFKEEMK